MLQRLLLQAFFPFSPNRIERKELNDTTQNEIHTHRHTVGAHRTYNTYLFLTFHLSRLSLSRIFRLYITNVIPIWFRCVMLLCKNMKTCVRALWCQRLRGCLDDLLNLQYSSYNILKIQICLTMRIIYCHKYFFPLQFTRKSMECCIFFFTFSPHFLSFALYYFPDGDDVTTSIRLKLIIACKHYMSESKNHFIMTHFLCFFFFFFFALPVFAPVWRMMRCKESCSMGIFIVIGMGNNKKGPIHLRWMLDGYYSEYFLENRKPQISNEKYLSKRCYVQCADIRICMVNIVDRRHKQKTNNSQLILLSVIGFDIIAAIFAIQQRNGDIKFCFFQFYFFWETHFFALNGDTTDCG